MNINLHLQRDVDYILNLVHVKFRYDHLLIKTMYIGGKTIFSYNHL
jgi:hypothetical protein